MPTVAEKFNSAADRLEQKIDDKTRPMTQNPTPKRMKEYHSRLHEGGNLQRTQKALRALAAAHENGTVPNELSELRSTTDIAPLVHKSIKGGGGYYDVIPDFDYYDKSPAGVLLQSMLESTTSESRAAKEKASTISQLEARVQFQGLPGYFPTPAVIAERMVAYADISDSMSVLEPSAGKGNIAEAVQRQSKAKLSVIEWSSQLREILTLKGFTLVGSDFLEHTERYDRILMNPPFEKGADIKHIKHAFSLLNPGGMLVAICAGGQRQQEELMPIASMWEPLETGSFKESGTGVSSVMLTIEKGSL